MSDEAQSPSHNGTTNARKEPGVEETGFEFSDDPKIQNRNTWRFVTGGLTAEGILQYVRDRDDRNEKEDCARCEKQRDYVLQYSMPATIPGAEVTELTSGRSHCSVSEREDICIGR